MNVLVLNQPFYPDVVSTAQYAGELAVELARQGHRVTALASFRGYDDPAVRFTRREVWKGVEIVRLPCTGLGKQAKGRRAIDFITFTVSCCWRLLGMRRFDLVVAMTTPPWIAFLAALLVPFRARKMAIWLMDMNPDEAIAAGWLKPRSLATRCLLRLQSFSFRRAAAIVVLDRFMEQRLLAKGVDPAKLFVIPPWTQDDTVCFDPQGREEFRAAHGLKESFVVMYSGNHSPCHPLDTLLDAVRELRGERDIAFCFVGGGSEFKRVQAVAASEKLANVVTVAYQPMEKLSGSLSAADLHVVVMGDGFEGIVHPSKIYNILKVGSPLLYIGPEPSFMTDIIGEGGEPANGWAGLARHGDTREVTRYIRYRRNLPGNSPVQRSDVHSRLAGRYSKRLLLPKMIGILTADAT